MKTLEEIKRAYPSLNTYGFAVKGGGPLEDYAESILLAAAWLQATQIKTRTRGAMVSMNMPKPPFEKNTGRYLPRGAMLAACMLAEFEFQREGSFAYVGVSRKTLSLALKTGGVPLAVLAKEPYQALLDEGFEFVFTPVNPMSAVFPTLRVFQKDAPLEDSSQKTADLAWPGAPKTSEEFCARARAGLSANSRLGKLLTLWRDELLFTEKAFMRYHKG